MSFLLICPTKTFLSTTGNRRRLVFENRDAASNKVDAVSSFHEQEVAAKRLLSKGRARQ